MAKFFCSYIVELFKLTLHRCIKSMMMMVDTHNIVEYWFFISRVKGWQIWFNVHHTLVIGCLLFLRDVENIYHLFIHCPYTTCVWNAIFQWFGVVWVTCLERLRISSEGNLVVNSTGEKLLGSWLWWWFCENHHSFQGANIQDIAIVDIVVSKITQWAASCKEF